MNKIVSLLMALVFAIALTMVVGFVVSSIKGYAYDFGSSLPYGIIIGLVVYAFGLLITAEGK